MIEVENLTKRYGDKVAVDDLTFSVQPGIVTGFLGPNGVGNPVADLRRSSALGSDPHVP
jgi:ABC-type Na+ transport system ATPase subunit NatA